MDKMDTLRRLRECQRNKENWELRIRMLAQQINEQGHLIKGDPLSVKLKNACDKLNENEAKIQELRLILMELRLNEEGC